MRSIGQLSRHCPTPHRHVMLPMRLAGGSAMNFASASQPTPGKQNRLHFGVQGSTEAPQASPPDGVRHLALRPIMQATNRGLRELPMPEAAQSPLLYAFCCFPPASPALAIGAGKQKRPRRAAFIHLKSLRDSGAAIATGNKHSLALDRPAEVALGRRAVAGAAAHGSPGIGESGRLRLCPAQLGHVAGPTPTP
jgi:hypothetical protein